MEQNIYEAKIITLGDSMVGKTCLILRFIENLFTSNYLSTIGFDLKKKLIKLENNEKIKLLIYDTAGQERFKSLSRNYIKKADGIMVIYDITNKETFKNVENWIICAKEEMKKNIPIYLVGNKADLEEDRKISYEEGKSLSEQYGLKFYETSCQTGDNVEKCFTDLAQDLYDIQKKEKEKENGDNNIKIETKKSAKKKKCC